jgi:hypothetical protein
MMSIFFLPQYRLVIVQWRDREMLGIPQRKLYILFPQGLIKRPIIYQVRPKFQVSTNIQAQRDEFLGIRSWRLSI